MKRKAEITYFPRIARLLQFAEQVEPEYLLPGVAVQSMQQIEINLIRLQALQLLAQNPVEIALPFYHPDGHFGGKMDHIPVSVGERAGGNEFTVPAQIIIGRINIIDSRIDCAPHHFHRHLLVLRQTHHAEPQRREPDARIAEISVYHESRLAFPTDFCEKG